MTATMRAVAGGRGGSAAGGGDEGEERLTERDEGQRGRGWQRRRAGAGCKGSTGWTRAADLVVGDELAVEEAAQATAGGALVLRWSWRLLWSTTCRWGSTLRGRRRGGGCQVMGLRWLMERCWWCVRMTGWRGEVLIEVERLVGVGTAVERWCGEAAVVDGAVMAAGGGRSGEGRRGRGKRKRRRRCWRSWSWVEAQAEAAGGGDGGWQLWGAGGGAVWSGLGWI